MNRFNIVYNKIKPYVSNYGLETTYLAGSIVFGNFDEYSDIDIVVIDKTKKPKRYIYTDIGEIDITIDTTYADIFYILDENQNKHPKTINRSVINIQTGEIVYGNPNDERIAINQKLKYKEFRNGVYKNTLSDVWGTNLIKLKNEKLNVNH